MTRGDDGPEPSPYRRGPRPWDEEPASRRAWYRGSTPRAVLAALVLTVFAIAVQGLLTRGQSPELEVARGFLTALFEGRYEVAAAVVDPSVEWLDDATELESLIEPFRRAAGTLHGLTAAVAARDDDEVREFVYCADGVERDVAGRIEVTRAVGDDPPRVVFLSRFFTPAGCQDAQTP